MRARRGEALVGINSLEDKDFVRCLIREPVPHLVRVEMQHTILGDIIGVNNIRVHEVGPVNTAGITYSKRPVSDRYSEGLPDSDDFEP